MTTHQNIYYQTYSATRGRVFDSRGLHSYHTLTFGAASDTTRYREGKEPEAARRGGVELS